MKGLIKTRASRRTFLKGLGLTAALPFLPSLATETEAQTQDYRRVIFAVWSHGVAKGFWTPQVAGGREVAAGVRSTPMSDATMGLYFQNHLAGLENKVSFLTGLGITGAMGHFSPAALTCSPRPADRNHRVYGSNPSSIDVVMARSGKVYRGAAPNLDVLRLGEGGGGHSFADSSAQGTLEPSVAYGRLFPGGVPAGDAPPVMTGPTVAELRDQRRLSRVQTVLERYAALRASGRLSAEDLPILDQSMAHYTELESRIQASLAAGPEGPRDTAACSPFNVTDSDDPEVRLQAQVRLFTQGFACDATRVGYWKLRSSHADVDGAHQSDSDANLAGTGIYTRIMRENVQKVATLLREMDRIVEGNGKTMLDNSLVVMCSDMATSAIGSHPGMDAPILLAGGLGGRFRMGEVIQYEDLREEGVLGRRRRTVEDFYRGGPPTNELFISIMKAFDLEPSDWEDGGRGFGFYSCNGAGAIRGDQVRKDQVKYMEWLDRYHLGSNPPGTELPYARIV